MKKILHSSIILFSIVLGGCTFFDNPKENIDLNDPDPINILPSDEIIDEQVGEFYGGIVESDKYIGYEFSSSKNVVRPSSGLATVDIYAFNDFHGAVLQNLDNNEPGLKLLGSFFKKKSQLPNTLILDQGDTWQGTFESNYNHGAIVQDVFNYSGVSLRTLGNHDFDWGLEQCATINNRKLGDDYIPCLGANIYDYKNGLIGNDQQEKYGKEYATFYLDNGLKIGVVGTIGKDQITSICSELVDTIAFTDHVKKTKEISDFLRVEKGCDIIISSCHEPAADSMLNVGLADISPISTKPYVDLVLNGHSHYEQSYQDNNVKFVQWDSDGRSIGEISLIYDFATKQVLPSSTTVKSLYYEDLNKECPSIDPTIGNMVENYLTEIAPIADEVLSTNFSGYFDTKKLANLMSTAIYDFVKDYETIDLAVCNYARNSFYGTTFTYRDLYKSFPFDNKIILMDVGSYKSYYSIINNYFYKENTELNITGYGHYRIAVIDYIGLHQNSDREYDYFPDATNLTIFNDNPLTMAPTYREILYNYLKNNSSKNFNSSDYSSGLPHYSA